MDSIVMDSIVIMEYDGEASNPDELAYPDGLYQYIYNMCFLHPINICAGFYYGNTIGAIMGLTLFGTSVNYWRYPVLTSYRRIIDMIVAFTCVSYHIYLSLFTHNKLLCAGTIIIGSMMYPLSLYFVKNNYNNYGTLCHCLLHALVILGACFIYRDYYLYQQCAITDVG